MKRILFVLGIVFCSCGIFTSYIYTEPEYKERDGRKIEVIEDGYTFDYVEFDGHEYVRYYNGYRGSVCHSPKCPCLIEYKK